MTKRKELTPHPPFEKKGVKYVCNMSFVLYNFNPVNLIFYPLNPVLIFLSSFTRGRYRGGVNSLFNMYYRSAAKTHLGGLIIHY
jgi:hypothetical protein